MIISIIPVGGELNKIYIGAEAFQIRLDHLLHFLVYFLICMYYLAGSENGYILFKESSLIKFTLLVLILAVVTESVQLWVPERAFNVFDMLSNVAGAGLGVGAIRMAQRRSGEEAQRINND